jgi:hypothetical protein
MRFSNNAVKVTLVVLGFLVIAVVAMLLMLRRYR